MNQIGVLLLALTVGGCASTYQSLKLSKIKPHQGVAIGRVFITINGVTNPPDKCGVCFNSVNGPCYLLNQTGLVFASLPEGQTTFRRIVCMLPTGSSAHSHFNFITFQNSSGKEITYFGDVNVTWETEGASLVKGMLGQLGPGQPVNDFNVMDYGTDVINVFKEYHEPGPDWTFTTNLIQTKPTPAPAEAP